MSARISKTQRWLDLISFLVGRHVPVGVNQVMEGVPSYAARYRDGSATDRESVRRMFERDKAELKEMGVPIETVPYTIHHGTEQLEGYRIRDRDFYLPYLRVLGEGGDGGSHGARRPDAGSIELDPEEADLARDALLHSAGLPHFPLADEARSALRKLSLDLPGVGEPAVRYASPPEGVALGERVRRLNAALLARRRVRFRYHGLYRGEATERDVASYALLFRSDWYLVGHDTLRDDIRVFRISRMEALEEGSEDDYRIPADFDSSGYLRGSPWEMGEEAAPLPVDVRFEFPRSLWVERNGFGTEVERLPGGAVVRRFEVSQVEPFLRWLLPLEDEARIESPDELRDQLSALAGRVAALHGVTGG